LHGPGIREWVVSVVVVGLEHQRAPLDVLERANVSDPELSKTLSSLRDRSNLLEVVVLSTCLRTEFYAVVERFHEGVTDLQEHLAESVGTTVEQLAEQLTVQFDDAVALHLFEVAAGLRSAIPGEHEVLGQVRIAGERAQAERASGPVLNHLFDRAVQAGRRVRAETSIGQGTTSLAQLSVDLAAERLAGRFGSAKVLVVGAGQMSRSVVAALRSRGVAGPDVTIVNRTIERAAEVAATVGGVPMGLDSLAGALADADSVIVTTSSPTPILDLDTVSEAMSARVGRRLAPLVVVDMSVPRNVDPSVGGLGGVELLDIGALRALADRALAGRRGELEHAESIVRDEVERYRADARSRGAAPQVAQLRGRMEDLRRQELDRIRGRAKDLTDEQWEQVGEVTRAVLAKLLHKPTVALKETSGTPRGERLVEAIHALFDL
jgi:glutamyl-tRNA reductase